MSFIPIFYPPEVEGSPSRISEIKLITTKQALR